VHRVDGGLPRTAESSGLSDSESNLTPAPQGPVNSKNLRQARIDGWHRTIAGLSPHRMVNLGLLELWPLGACSSITKADCRALFVRLFFIGNSATLSEVSTMAKNDQEEAFEKVLNSSLARTIDFIKFAEAKNAAALTFSSAWILATANAINNVQNYSALWRICLSIAFPLFVFGAISAIISFIPITDLMSLYKNNSREKCLIYFGDVANMTISEYKSAVVARYCPSNGQFATGAYLDDLVAQIAVNSSIAARKFYIFNFSAIFALLGVIASLVPAFFQIYGLF
jgi:hypothetical protein